MVARRPVSGKCTKKNGVVDFCCSQEEFICYWVRYFDLDTDYEVYMNAANPRDKYLNAAIEAGDGIRILGRIYGK